MQGSDCSSFGTIPPHTCKVDALFLQRNLECLTSSILPSRVALPFSWPTLSAPSPSIYTYQRPAKTFRSSQPWVPYFKRFSSLRSTTGFSANDNLSLRSKQNPLSAYSRAGITKTGKDSECACMPCSFPCPSWIWLLARTPCVPRGAEQMEALAHEAFVGSMLQCMALLPVVEP